MKNSIKVLIVDDDRSSATLISEVVKRMGFKPVLASKATDGLNIAKLQSVHAAVVDVMLPKMSGVDLAIAFRTTKFSENPIILVSGVFKDKAFAADAMRKSGAIDFLFKPYSAEDLMAALNKALAGQLVEENFTLPSLLTRRLTTVRERAKAIENLEPIQGTDFPFVLSVLLDKDISGHLNLVSEAGEIFGLTLSRGTIAEVDSAEAQSTGVLALVNSGFLAQEDWDLLAKSGKKKITLERLVSEGLVSPHAVSEAKHEQILLDFKTICGSSGLRLNFVPQDESDEPPKHAVGMHALLKILGKAMDEFFPEEHLTLFYKNILTAPMTPLRTKAEIDMLFQNKIFASVPALRETVEAGGTLDQALSKHQGSKAKLYACLHFLVLNRAITFSDLQQTKALNAMLERYRELYRQLIGKFPHEVYAYFGAGEKPNPVAVEKIYNDYVKANHPNQIPREAPPELLDLAKQCFAIVEDAHAVMSNDERRSELFESIKNESEQHQRRSNELTAKGLELLRKGQFKQALESLQEAERIYPTTLQLLIQTWAELKSGQLNTKAQQVERQKRIESLPSDDRRSTFYFMALGLLKRAQGDPSAATIFEKALQLDPNFNEARRELNVPTAAKDKKIDILNGDITEIVSQLFRRKAD